jgi:hypothetical protein
MRRLPFFVVDSGHETPPVAPLDICLTRGAVATPGSSRSALPAFGEERGSSQRSRLPSYECGAGAEPRTSMRVFDPFALIPVH